jgi:hypothetical protein
MLQCHVDEGSSGMKQVSTAVIAVAAFVCSTCLSLGWSEQAGISLSVESAQARVGRPATPASVAGVARRQTRRSYGHGVAGAAAVGAAVVGTAAAVGAAGYYGGPGYYSGGPANGYYGGGSYYGQPVQPYAGPNGFVCQPGSMVTLDDGRTYPCQ